MTKTTKPTTVVTALHSSLSASFQVTPNEHAPKDAEALGGVMYKGKTAPDGDKDGFQAVINGTSGPIRPSFSAALTFALQALNVVPANYDRPTKWSDIYQDNKPPVINSFDDLDEVTAKAYAELYDTLGVALTAQEAKEGEARAAAFAVAETVVTLRSKAMNRKAWKELVKLGATYNAAANVAAFFTSKNSVGEAFKAGKIIGLDGFDADNMLGSRVSGNKGVVSAFTGVVNDVAKNVVGVIRSDKCRKKLGIKKGDGDTGAIRLVLADMVANGQWSMTEAGSEQVDDINTALAGLVIPALFDAFPPEPFVFIQSENDGFMTAKDGDGNYPAESLFGIEGPNELIAALVRAMSAHVSKAATSAAVDTVADAAADLVNTAKETKTPFEAWPIDLAAKHLTKVLFAGWDAADDRESAADRVDAILARMGDLANAIIEDNANLDDVLNFDADAPSTAEEAEDDADAGL